jgi:hypothetical protein
MCTPCLALSQNLEGSIPPPWRAILSVIENELLLLSVYLGIRVRRSGNVHLWFSKSFT